MVFWRCETEGLGGQSRGDGQKVKESTEELTPSKDDDKIFMVPFEVCTVESVFLSLFFRCQLSILASFSRIKKGRTCDEG